MPSYMDTTVVKKRGAMEGEVSEGKHTKTSPKGGGKEKGKAASSSADGAVGKGGKETW